MAMLDYGVLVFKDGKMLENTDGDDNSVRNGAGGHFTHKQSGVNFYRMSIKNHVDIDSATERVSLFSKLTYGRKKVLQSDVGGLSIRTKEIYPQTYMSTFKDVNGDTYKVIQGYDVGLSNFHSKQREKVIKKFSK